MSAVLYQFWRSSASWRVRWALAVKGVPFESEMIDLAQKQQYSEEHLARNPFGRVPVLSIDGRHFAESVSIIEYLEDRFPVPRLYPADPVDRARVRQIVELINSGIQPYQNTSAYAFHSESQDEQNRWCNHFNTRGMVALEGLLEQFAGETGVDGPFAYGDSFTVADIFLVPQLFGARRFGVDLTKFPRVTRAEKAALATQYARAALPENQPGAPARSVS